MGNESQEYFFQEGEELAFSERQLFNDKAIDRRPYDIDDAEAAKRNEVLHTLLEVVISEAASGRTEVTPKSVYYQFEKISLLAPTLGLTLRERWNLSSDRRWKTYCLTHSAPIEHPDHIERH